jgi:hypothetical protein
VIFLTRPLLRAALVAVFLASQPLAAGASLLEAFVGRLGEAQVQFRTTTAALRAGRADEAEQALKKLVIVWSQISDMARERPPAVFAQVPFFPELIAGTGARLKKAADSLADGRADAALEDLLPLRRDWINLRRSAGFYGFVECLDEASAMLEPVIALRRATPDLTRAEVRGDIIAKAAVYRYALKRCEGFAGADLASDSDYRRLADAAFAALDVAATALRLRDQALLERVLTDLKSYDAQLSQRFGG